MPTETLLEVRGLDISFRGRDRWLPAVDGLDLSLARGETLGLVGESGCGKSVTALSLLGLLPRNASRVAGSIRLDGQELTSLDDRGWRTVRGRRIGMVFQDPMTALNPLLTVGAQVTESLRSHLGLSHAAARDEAAAWLSRVGIPDPKARLRNHPHEMSGGMRQRVLIAMALCSRPEILLADEPTTALDVTIQAQILELLADLQAELGMAMVFITHDLGVVERVADRLAVMYAGKVAESGVCGQILSNPRHPYTQGLLGAVPGFRPRTGRLTAIPGLVPSAGDRPEGCRFAPRCPRASERCTRSLPPLEGSAGHACACWFPAALASSSGAVA
jgi:oligopeptide/dipeptide ABC transporter ATP-binding protein